MQGATKRQLSRLKLLDKWAVCRRDGLGGRSMTKDDMAPLAVVVIRYIALGLILAIPVKSWYQNVCDINDIS